MLQAHAISEWGHDFRFAYRKLSVFKERFNSTPVCGTLPLQRAPIGNSLPGLTLYVAALQPSRQQQQTGTFVIIIMLRSGLVGRGRVTQITRVQTDVVNSLRLDKPLIITLSFNRPNIYYEVRFKVSAHDLQAHAEKRANIERLRT